MEMHKENKLGTKKQKIKGEKKENHQTKEGINAFQKYSNSYFPIYTAFFLTHVKLNNWPLYIFFF
jgi:hypothetical protein